MDDQVVLKVQEKSINGLINNVDINKSSYGNVMVLWPFFFNQNCIGIMRVPDVIYAILLFSNLLYSVFFNSQTITGKGFA